MPWGVQYRGGYYEYSGGYLGDIMMHVGDIMSTVGVFSTVGENLLSFEYPHGTEHLHGTHDIPHMYHNIPTVLSTNMVFKIPHIYHYIPHGTAHTLYKVKKLTEKASV